MKETIYHINKPRGMFYVELENNSFAVFELLDCNDMSQGDFVSGLFDCEGFAKTFNYTTNENSEILIQNI